MAINFFFEGITKFSLQKSKDKAWVINCITKQNNEAGDINFIFCSDPYLLKLNKKHLNHDYYTDIITFDYCAENIISGDIYISIDRVFENSAELNTTFDNELHRVMIHGILHLLGLHDSTEIDKKEMRREEDNCLDSY